MTNRAVTADDNGSLPAEVRARLAAEIQDGGSEVGAVTVSKDPATGEPDDLHKGWLGGTYGTRNAVLAKLRDALTTPARMPAAMSSPPTVVVDNTSASISGVTIAPTSLTVLGLPSGDLIDNGFGYFRSPGVYNSDAGSSQRYIPWAVEFDFEGTAFELEYAPYSGSKMRILVDGDYVASPYSLANAPTSSRYTTVTFSGREKHRIRVEITGGVQFRYVRAAVTCGVHKTPVAGLTGLVMGDSYTAGTGADIQHTSFAYQLGRLLGWGNIMTNGGPSTGYLQTYNGMGTFRTRLATDVTARNPDIVILTGGYNDSGATATALGAEAALLFDAAIAAMPDALIAVVSPFYPGGSPGATRLAQAAAIETEATNRGLIYVDCINPSVITGSGSVGATNGTGNADYYTYTDGVHPSQAGHDFLARVIAAEIVSQLPSAAF